MTDEIYRFETDSLKILLLAVLVKNSAFHHFFNILVPNLATRGGTFRNSVTIKTKCNIFSICVYNMNIQLLKATILERNPKNFPFFVIFM